MKDLKAIAESFRIAIEKCDCKLLPITFERFPHGSCGDVAPLLGTFLIENEFGEFDYMLGSVGKKLKPGWHSHAWLEKNGMVVDITADQFSDITNRVIVERDSKWHKNLNGKRKHVADFRIYDAVTVSRLQSAYNVILGHI